VPTSSTLVHARLWIRHYAFDTRRLHDDEGRRRVESAMTRAAKNVTIRTRAGRYTP
jgi:hypothetical protein